MNSDFREGIQALLEEATPRGGVVALLYRHPFGSVYYPLAVHASNELPTTDADLLHQYFIFSTRLEEQDFANGRQIEIRADAPADLLLQHGKLAIHFFPKSDLRVRFHLYEYDATRQIVLAVIDPLKSGVKGPSETLLRAIVYIARGWTQSSERLLSPAGTNSAEILESVTRILEDSGADPPFFPILHTHVSAGAGATSDATRAGAPCGNNRLSYNCALWSRCEILRSTFIDDIFRKAHQTPCFEHQIPDSTDPLALAVAQICDDIVCKLAVAPSGAMLCAQFNVPRELKEKAKERLSRSGTQCAEVDSDWNLVKRGMNLLMHEDEYSALVTMWVGKVEDGKVIYALPLGFAPGKQQHYLAEIAKAPALASLRESIPSAGEQVEINVLRLEEESRDYWPRVRAIIESLANAAEERLCRPVSTFPPPYILDFQGGKTGEQPLRITSGNSSASPLVVRRSDQSYVFYLLLARAKETSDAIITHGSVASLVFDKSDLPKQKVSKLVEDKVRGPLKCHGVGDKDVDLIVHNVKGQGWELGGRATVKGLSADALNRFTESHAEWKKYKQKE